MNKESLGLKRKLKGINKKVIVNMLGFKNIKEAYKVLKPDFKLSKSKLLGIYLGTYDEK